MLPNTTDNPYPCSVRCNIVIFGVRKARLFLITRRHPYCTRLYLPIIAIPYCTYCIRVPISLRVLVYAYEYSYSIYIFYSYEGRLGRNAFQTAACCPYISFVRYMTRRPVGIDIVRSRLQQGTLPCCTVGTYLQQAILPCMVTLSTLKHIISY